MMMKRVLFVTSCAALVLSVSPGCDSGAKKDARTAVPTGTEAPAEPGEQPTTESAAAPTSTGDNHFGAAFTRSDATPLAAVVAKSDEAVGSTVQVRGRVTSVCKKKGCWFVIQDADAPSVRVTMKDYGFFVPKDCDGKLAVVEGELQRKIITEKTRKHLAEDEGKDPSTVTGDKEELGLVATGVQLEQ
jgi:hypothetical protein